LTDYDFFPGLKDRDLPRHILVSDFARFRLYDLEARSVHEFPIRDFHKHVRRFGFVAGYITTVHQERDLVNIHAAEKMGKLHDKLKAIGYDGHELQVYLVRLLFCLFADDAAIFERKQFQDLIELRTAEDGQDLAQWLGRLFEVLNTPPEKRLRRIDEKLAEFGYVNGSLFTERLRIAGFDCEMREILLDCCALDWSLISPAIFGALFQSAMNTKSRRNLGAHYSSEKNVLKVIQPLFLEKLRAEFERIKDHPRQLAEFHDRVSKLKFFDPACGCGNFLVVAYRELRLLELDIIRAMCRKSTTRSPDVTQFKILCDVDQFYGIEIEEFPAQIAQIALWMTDHQMNMRVSEEFGNGFSRLPLTKSGRIVHGNALELDWRTIVKPAELNYVLGNPPFGGKRYQSREQKSDLARVFKGIKGAGVLDFAAPWYRLAVEYMCENPDIETGFVSTSSITQGEQVSILWRDLLDRGARINFAHRTFQWSSEARGKAAVHCVIIGFALHDAAEKRLFDYETIQGEPHETGARNINPYLVDATDILPRSRRTSVSDAPAIGFGSMPNDGGHLMLSPEERAALLEEEPRAAKWIRPILGSIEFLNGKRRFCLWLAGISPQELRRTPAILKRLEAVRKERQGSSRSTTRKLAATPALFGEIRQPAKRYLAVPKTSSEGRLYIPMGFLQPAIIANTELFTIAGATNYEFGVLSSAMHMGWVRSVCGRLKSDYRYSAGIVYNNFPWPQEVSDAQRKAIENAAQAVLDARAEHGGASLAELYDPLAMPVELVRAHRKLDLAVDAAYAKKKFSGDADRVAFLFDAYGKLVDPLDPG